MNQIVKNVEKVLENEFIDTDQKLVLYYLKQFEGLRFDNKYISTQDLLDIDMKLIQSIMDAKYLLELLEDEDD